MSKIRLAFFDMEGTIFRQAVSSSETTVAPSAWVAIAQRLGQDAYEEELQTQKRWKSGGYRCYLDWMQDTISIHQKYGLRRTDFEDILSHIDFMPGAAELFGAFRDRGVPTALISGGFKFQADRAVAFLKIPHAFASCEYFWDANGRLSHWNLLPGDYMGKTHFMRMLAEEYGVPIEECAFVGDGENDSRLAQLVGVSVAFNGAPELVKVTTHSVCQPRGQESLAQLLEILELRT
jgi:phosphoserine phosphatase